MATTKKTNLKKVVRSSAQTTRNREAIQEGSAKKLGGAKNDSARINLEGQVKGVGK